MKRYCSKAVNESAAVTGYDAPTLREDWSYVFNLFSIVCDCINHLGFLLSKSIPT